MKADHTTHDLPLDEIILPIQQMFPNCQRYKKCCRKDEEFWKKVSEIKPLHNGFIPTSYTKIIKPKNNPAPEGFVGW